MLGACTSLTHTVEKTPLYPELGAIGVFNEYVLDSHYSTKAYPALKDPVRLSKQLLSIQKRTLFAAKDSSAVTPKDSLLVRFEMLDKMKLITQLNADKPGLEYLKKAEDYRIVTAVHLDLDEAQLQRIAKADSYYLVNHKTGTLSIELRKDDAPIDMLEFSECTIVEVDYANFCWGQNQRREIVIFDMIPPGSKCNPETYRTARKAKKKHQINFWK